MEKAVHSLCTIYRATRFDRWPEQLYNLPVYTNQATPSACNTLYYVKDSDNYLGLYTFSA